MTLLSRIACSTVLAAVTMTATAATADELRIAAIFPDGVENAWTKAWLDSLDVVKEQAPHGMEITLDYTENVFGDTIMEVLEAYSESGKYDIIWTHQASSDEVEELKDQYPDILYVSTGGGNRPVGGNGFQGDIYMHEASYLVGIYAGLESEFRRHRDRGSIPLGQRERPDQRFPRRRALGQSGCEAEGHFHRKLV